MVGPGDVLFGNRDHVINEFGDVRERVDVVATAVILDTNAVSSGLTFENRLLTELPTFSSMPLLLIRNVSGVAASAAPQFATQGFVGGPSAQAGPIGGVGATEYTIDGATNAGNARNVATSPNSDMLQEMRIETANFDASVGHGTGLGVSMMTKAGTNRWSGLAAYQAWTSRLNGANHFQQPILEADPELKKVFESGKSTNLSFTVGGPIVIPKVVDGRNKLFFFANYSFVADLIPGNIQAGAITLPTAAHLRGDFSDLLLLPNPQQYRIYDPLTARPDPNRPGRIIRDPFPNNIIPPHRIVNPAYGLYTQFLPAPMVEKVSGDDGATSFNYSWPERSVGKVHAFFGNFGMHVRAWTYIRMHGADGLRRVSEDAVLAANYLLANLKDRYDLPYERTCMHEFVLSGRRQKALGVRTLDIAKRLLDFGVHPPTTYFPLIVEEALMIEPTETESIETLDAFIVAMRQIADEVEHDPEYVRTAPHFTEYKRLDDVAANRNLNLRWLPEHREEAAAAD
jgi:hypothetical protein